MIPRVLPERPSPSRRVVLLCLAGLLALLALAPAASADVFTPESGGSPNADDIDTLYKVVFFISIPIFILVEGLIIYCLIKFKSRRDGPEAEQLRGNEKLELGWTAGAALILLVIGVVTFAFLGGIKDPPASGPDGLAQGVQVANIDQPDPPAGSGKSLDITVVGQQYIWRYDYPDTDNVYGYYEMVVPTDTTVTLKIKSSDVAHSWWIPKLGGKADAVPGHTNETWFKIAKPGIYEGQCAELCGDNHADMRARVRAVSPEEYTRYIESRGQELQQAQTDLDAQRKERAAIVGG